LKKTSDTVVIKVLIIEHTFVMPDLIRHPENLNWLPALVPFRVFAGKTTED
jgi:hypothetical protein